MAQANAQIAARCCRRLVAAGGLIVALLLPLCLNPFAARPFEPVKVPFFISVVAAMSLARLTRLMLERRRGSAAFPVAKGSVSPSAAGPLVWCILLYLGVLAAATIGSVDPQRSLFGQQHSPHGLLTALSLVAFCLLIYEAAQEPHYPQQLTGTLLLGSMPVITYGLAQYIGRDPFDWTLRGVSPVFSTMGNTIYLGAYLAMVAPFSLLRIATAGERSERLRYGLVAALQVLCLLLTRARSALLALMAGGLLFLGYWAWRGQRRALLLGLLAAVLLGGVLFVAISIEPRVPGQAATGPTPQFRTYTLNERHYIWSGTVAAIKERWLLGYGPETFAPVFAAHSPPELDNYLPSNEFVDDPHNILLEHLVSAGIPGLLAFAALVVAFFRTVARALVRRPAHPQGDLLAAIAASVLAFLVYAQFNPDVIVLSALFWLDLALAAALIVAPPRPVHN